VSSLASDIDTQSITFVLEEKYPYKELEKFTVFGGTFET